MAANDITDDIIEQILIRLDVKDVMRCKGVCRSWHSLISSPYFAESHLKHTNNDPELTYKRITGRGNDYGFLCEDVQYVVGSANGLVCVSPQGFQLLVVNPFTRQAIKILEPPPEPYLERAQLVWGFGYDSFNNDYKIVVGRMTETSTRFYVLSLKTCVWKFIQEYGSVGTNYYDIVPGILCDGELHWVMKNPKTKELAIFSFDLSREEFINNIQLPDGHSVYEPGTRYTLGVMEGSLCLNVVRSPYSTEQIWVSLRSDTEYYWELLPDNYAIKYEAVYLMNEDDYSIPHTPKLLNSGEYIGAPMYLRSLVSPYHAVNHMDSSSKSAVISMARKNVIIRRVRRILIPFLCPEILFVTCILCVVVAIFLNTPSVNQRKLIR